MKYVKFLSYPLPFCATQINNPFLNSWISANHDKVEILFSNDEILIKGIVSLLYNLFCFTNKKNIKLETLFYNYMNKIIA